MKDKKQMRICAVCGDLATVRNFGAFTCKSCKPFFRRNANNKELFKCKSGGNCLINRNTRKSCRKCRLDKCFAVGMKKELIRTDGQKSMKKLIEQKRQMRSQEERHAINETIEPKVDETTPSVLFCPTNTANDKTLINKNDLREGPEYYSQISILDPKNNEKNSNDDQISQINCFLTITEAIDKSLNLYKTTFDFLTKSLIIPRPVLNYDQNYTELEEYKFAELVQVFQPLLRSLDKDFELIMINNMFETPKPNNIFYERGIKILIKATKMMNAFENICENDKIALVKYSSIDITILRSIQCYDLKNESWIIEMDKERAFMLKLDLLKSLNCDVYVNYKNYLYDIIKECDSDHVILNLLTAMALFNPNRPNLINKELVRVQHQFYVHLLQRYLTFKYRTKCESESKSVKIVKTLINAHILSEIERKYFIEGYQEHYGPLVKEVFDL